jgi:hypothetical protein
LGISKTCFLGVVARVGINLKIWKTTSIADNFSGIRI